MITFPAAYLPYVQDVLDRTGAEIQRDVERRADEDARVQALATVPDHLLDAPATGTLALLSITRVSQ